ncbi:hypothetical protein [Hwangdonia lutea]|uniref:Uncharacterized protein n=1 Tax=Hwangdonia lutea TaxID=3075823 RepID=A0AA97EN81_9FLAO|nr:hypothetical protein [Hwangdonia sp. SCSIO 19198]WOD43088.1 hypothetical protein RNZ46_13935 [Hwangdonia sp. SCSIO 19198]
MKNFKKASFLSLNLGWIGLIITHVIWSNLKYKNASGGDTGVVIFWSSFFLIIFYVFFILIPKKKIVKLTEKLAISLFTLLSGIYALIGFIILIGWGFLISDNFYGVFLDAFVFGLIFGLTFHLIWNKKQKAFKQMHLIPILTLPILFLFIYLFAFPKLFPSMAYNVVPQYLRHDILKNTIPKFKVGDDLSELQKALPGEFEFEKCFGSRGAVLNNFQFVIEVNCCKIVRIEFGPRQKTGYTMGGKRKPCI